MLYDVLPPLVFFTSLGGIILIVFRVVLRVRRQQFTNTVEATMQQSGPRGPSEAEDLAKIIGPSNKSVHVLKNRVAAMSHTIGSNAARVRTALQQRRADKETAARTHEAERTKQANAAESKVSFLNRAQRWSERSRHAMTSRARSLRERVSKEKPEVSTKKEETKTEQKPRLSMKHEKPPSDAGIVRKALGTQAATGTRNIFDRSNKNKKATPLSRAQEALNATDYQKAERILVPYLAKHPEETSAYMMLGEAAMGRRNWEEAIEIFEQVIQINPRVRGSFAALGRAAYEAGKFTRAIEALQRAHDADPRDVKVIERLLKIANRMDNEPMQRSLREELVAIKMSKSEQASNERQSIPQG